MFSSDLHRSRRGWEFDQSSAGQPGLGVVRLVDDPGAGDGIESSVGGEFPKARVGSDFGRVAAFLDFGTHFLTVGPVKKRRNDQVRAQHVDRALAEFPVFEARFGHDRTQHRLDLLVGEPNSAFGPEADPDRFNNQQAQNIGLSEPISDLVEILEGILDRADLNALTIDNGGSAHLSSAGGGHKRTRHEKRNGREAASCHTKHEIQFLRWSFGAMGNPTMEYFGRAPAPACEDFTGARLGGFRANARRKTSAAACQPAMPWTPGPGGVAAEQR